MNFDKNMHIKKLEELIDSEENLVKVKHIKNNIQNKDVYIYGAGYVGGDIYNLLKEYSINILGFLDRRGGNEVNYFDKPVYKAEGLKLSIDEKASTLVVVSLNCSRGEFTNIKSWLNELGYSTVIYFGEIYNYEMVERKRREVIKTASLLEDRESHETFYNYINALINSNPDLYPANCGQPEYFVENIPFKKGYSRFIDCGAFDGDTAINLKKYKKSIDAIAIFEPDCHNFKKISNLMNENRVAEEQILFPCAVWNDTAMIRFSDNHNTQSHITADGNTFVQAVDLDTVIMDFAPSFIKMDVEGAEYNALLGAKKMIEKFTPDLAICVYHSVNHLWEIPLLLKSINSEYDFYLRSHGELGIETVLYATSKR